MQRVSSIGNCHAEWKFKGRPAVEVALDQELPHDFLVPGFARHPRLAGDGQREENAKGLAMVDHQLVMPEQFGFMGGHGLVNGIFADSCDLGSLANQEHTQPPEPQWAGLRKEKIVGFTEAKRIGRD